MPTAPTARVLAAAVLAAVLAGCSAGSPDAGTAPAPTTYDMSLAARPPGYLILPSRPPVS